MSSGKGRKSGERGLFRNYFVYIISFLAIALAVTVCALLIANEPVTELVHKAENHFSASARDIRDDIEPNSREKEYIGRYGDRLGSISIDSCGVNCDLFYGSNRASMRAGAGLSDNESADLGSNSVKLIAGYDETYFSALKYAKVGDVINIYAGDTQYSYRITDAKYIEADTQAYKSQDKDMLVLCSIMSDFSQHSGEYYYVFADRINGEGE